MRSQLNKDIQALCLQFIKVYKLIKTRRSKTCRQQNIYLFLLNNHKEHGIQTRFHHPDFDTTSMHDRFGVEAEIQTLHTLLDALAKTLSVMTNTPKDDLQIIFTFHKLFNGAPHIFLDTPTKRLSRYKTTQAGRYDFLEQDILENLAHITGKGKTQVAA